MWFAKHSQVRILWIEPAYKKLKLISSELDYLPVIDYVGEAHNTYKAIPIFIKEWVCLEQSIDNNVILLTVRIPVQSR